MHRYSWSHSRTERPDAGSFERHCHSAYELLFVLHGHGDFIVEGTHYPLRDGTVLLTRPHEYHYVRPDSNTPYERYVINFDATLPVGSVSDLPILFPTDTAEKGIYSASPDVISHIADALSVVDLLAEQTAGVKESAVRSAVTQAILLLFLQGSDSENATGNETVSALVDYIGKHLTENLSLDDLSKTFYISKYHLCRLFRDYTGMPILHYINTKRMALAVEWLSEGIPAEEVSVRLGFGDYSAFYRRFVGIYGKKPTEFRKK